MRYEAVFEDLFAANLKRYASMRGRVQKRIDQLIQDPYQATERLGRAATGKNLLGCRSVHIGRNFRVIFVVCEECLEERDCEYCFCDGLAAKTIVFLTVGPHDKAYKMK